MLLGGFKGTRPLLEGYAAFADFNSYGQVFFLVDTGADASLIGPGDCIALGLDLSLHPGHPHVTKAPTPVIGIGGPIWPYLVRVHLFFPRMDPKGNPLPLPYCRSGMIDILTPALMPSQNPAEWPMSCLGWDVLQHMDNIDFHLGQGKILFHLPA